MENVVQEVRIWVSHAIRARTFKKGTHVNLLNLIAAFLDVTPPGFTFRFNKPETVCNARFGQRAQLYLTIKLLERQLNFLTREQHQEVSTMAVICGLLYGPGFLKSPLLARASFNDLSSISHFRQLEQFYPEASRAALDLWERHLDYLTPQHIPWSLVNDDFTEEERQSLANALLRLLPHRVRHMPPARVSYPGPIFSRNPHFWSQDGSLPSLELLAGPESFLIFNIAEVSDQDLREWLEAPVDQWSSDRQSPNYKFAYDVTEVMATKFHADNDNAESSLKEIKETVGRYHGEEMFQHGLVTLFEERKMAPADKTGKISKANLKKIVRN